MSTSGRRLLLVGWDSADWQVIHPLLDKGTLRGVQWLVEGGTSGNLSTLEPQLSPMLWTSIATGRMAYDHGVAGFTEVDARGRVVPVSWATRRCKTVWEILGSHGLRSHVISWFATHGEQGLNGMMVSNLFCHLAGVRPGQDPADWPPTPPGTYWPPEIAHDMDALRVSPYEVDPDEILRLFVPEAPNIDQKKDPRLWMLVKLLAEAASVHAAATHALETQPDWNFGAVYYRALDEICHIFMRYHPPQMPGVTDGDFRLYREVVGAAYRLHDLFLQRLIQLAGPEATVMLVSDHGFRSDHLRPQFTPGVPAGITVWHRPQGVFAVRGPGIKKDELVFGARLLDVTPTILHAFGLPTGADMEGRVLEEIFEERRIPATIPTWEDPGGIRREASLLEDSENEALIRQFVALGYIEDPGQADGGGAADTRRENDWNIARAFLHCGRYLDALPLLERCFHEQPGRTDYAQVFARCCLLLGMTDEAHTALDCALAELGPGHGAMLLKASAAIEGGHWHAAVQILEEVRESNPGDPEVWLLLAQSHVALRRWSDAETSAQKAIELDPHNPRPRLALARQKLYRGLPEDAVESALEGIGLDYGNPHAHFLLGAALHQMERWEDACAALENCLALNPTFLRALRLRSRALRRLGRVAEAATHEQRCFALMLQSRDEVRQQIEIFRAGTAERKKGYADPPAPGAGPGEYLIVSGLPRSGTSLMMQVLRAGGVGVMTDGKRCADEDNPEGYWEWEEVKKLPREPGIIEQAGNKAVKVISALLPKLSARHRYKVIFMMRPIAEVVSSQSAMLARSEKGQSADQSHLLSIQEDHRREILAFLHANPQCEVLEVSYPEMVSEPRTVMERLATFLPGRFSVTSESLDCVKPSLHRQKACVPKPS